MLDYRGVRLQRCWITEVLDYRGVGLQRCWITEVLDYRGSLYKGPDHRGGVIFWDYARTFNIT